MTPIRALVLADTVEAARRGSPHGIERLRELVQQVVIVMPVNDLIVLADSMGRSCRSVPNGAGID